MSPEEKSFIYYLWSFIVIFFVTTSRTCSTNFDFIVSSCTWVWAPCDCNWYIFTSSESIWQTTSGDFLSENQQQASFVFVDHRQKVTPSIFTCTAMCVYSFLLLFIPASFQEAAVVYIWIYMFVVKDVIFYYWWLTLKTAAVTSFPRVLLSNLYCYNLCKCLKKYFCSFSINVYCLSFDIENI